LAGHACRHQTGRTGPHHHHVKLFHALSVKGTWCDADHGAVLLCWCAFLQWATIGGVSLFFLGTFLMNDDTLNALAASLLFQGLSPCAFQDVLAGCHMLNLEQDQVLLEPGQANHTLYVLLAGELHVRVARCDTEPVVSVPVGDCVGEVSLIDKRPPSSFVLAAVPSQVMGLPEPVVLNLIRRDPLLALNLMRLQAHHFRRQTEMLKFSRSAALRLRSLAQTDALTGLYNRAWANETLAAQLAASTEAGQALSLAMIDVDHFKSINDRYGHPSGDAVLQAVARTLRERFRSTDGVFRYGGEEFLVMMPGTPLHLAVEMLNALRTDLADTPIPLPDAPTHSVCCTISIGVAQYQAPQVLNDLISLADRMLYHAKRGGRNRVMAEMD
jgi:diguanylate cyclase (GGDEF)-like protein